MIHATSLLGVLFLASTIDAQPARRGGIDQLEVTRDPLQQLFDATTGKLLPLVDGLLSPRYTVADSNGSEHRKGIHLSILSTSKRAIHRNHDKRLIGALGKAISRRLTHDEGWNIYTAATSNTELDNEVSMPYRALDLNSHRPPVARFGELWKPSSDDAGRFRHGFTGHLGILS